MRRDQTAHETLIPWLVRLIGARSYLEFGVHAGETITKVECERRYGVDVDGGDFAGCTIFKMTTQEFIDREAAGLAPFDFVFIDADHSCEQVERDFDGIWPHVSKDGIIALHDTNPETPADTAPGLCADSWRHSRRLHERGVESLTLPYHPGLTLVRKRLWWGPE